MNIIFRPALGLLFLLVTAPFAEGALTLQINPTTRQFALVGSSTGSPSEGEGGFNPVTFQFDGDGSGSLGAGFNSAVSTVTALDDFYTIDRADPNPSLRISSVFDRVSFGFFFGSSEPLTITGTGEFFDYGTRLAGFDTPPPSVRFDMLSDGDLLFVNDGTGFDGGITVQIIPEPNTALLSLLGLLPLCRRRRP